MKNTDLKIGDRIRIIAVPGEGVPNYYIHKDTVKVFKKLIERKRSVRVFEIDEYGQPWYKCQFRRKNGKWEYHWISVGFGEESSWVLVKPRKK